MKSTGIPNDAFVACIDILCDAATLALDDPRRKHEIPRTINSITSLAHTLGVSTQTLRRWRKGEHLPPFLKRVQILTEFLETLRVAALRERRGLA